MSLYHWYRVPLGKPLPMVWPLVKQEKRGPAITSVFTANAFSCSWLNPRRPEGRANILRWARREKNYGFHWESKIMTTSAWYWFLNVWIQTFSVRVMNCSKGTRRVPTIYAFDMVFESFTISLQLISWSSSSLQRHISNWCKGNERSQFWLIQRFLLQHWQ